MLELSGGVRSLPQVPQWNAVRRARSAEREPHPKMRRLGNTRLPAFCFLLFALQTPESSEPKRSRFRSLKPVLARGFLKLGARMRRGNGNAYPPPRERGTTRSVVAQGASDPTLHFR